MAKRIAGFLVVLFVCLMSTSASAEISPSELICTRESDPSCVMYMGQSTLENKSVTITNIPKADVIFAFDLTGSMGDELATMKAEAINIMNELSDPVNPLIEDAQYGVMSMLDYPQKSDWPFEPFDPADNCGYETSPEPYYGASNVKAFSLNNAVTDDILLISDSINDLTGGDGGDHPEAYSRLLYETYADLEAVGWRDGSKRIVILLGDDVPHDCNINKCLGLPEDEDSLTGMDPGRDEKLPSDPGDTDGHLEIMDVLAGMAANEITLLTIWSKTPADDDYSKYWECWTAITGGQNWPLDAPEEIPGAIKGLIEGIQLDNLCLKGCGDWLSSVVPHTNGFPGDPNNPECFGEIGVIDEQILDFDITLTVPQDFCDGKDGDILHECEIAAVSNGTAFGTQKVKITVDCTPPENLKKCGRGTVESILMHRSDEDTDVPIDISQVTLNFTTDSDQNYVLSAKAFGTQINLALLKAHNWNEEVSLCLKYRLFPFKATVTKVDFDTPPGELPCPGPGCCKNASECDDGQDCTDDLCDPNSVKADSKGCLNVPLRPCGD